MGFTDVYMELIKNFPNYSFDMISALVFMFGLGIICFINRDKIAVQKIVFPFLYIIMYRTKLGIKFMDKIVKKNREGVKLFGYISIGIGFLGMALMTLLLVMTVIKWVTKPAVEEYGFQLVLPFTNIPGIGYLSFWYFIISIFVLAVAHEFCHGVVARAHNLKLKSTGFALFSVLLPILPAAFVEPDEKQLRKANDIAQYSVYSAGPMANFVLAIIFGLLMLFAVMPLGDMMTEPTGFSYNLINESYPAVLSGMPLTSSITAVNGYEVKDLYDFQIEMLRVNPGENISLTANNTDYFLTTVSNPNDERSAFIGIRPIQNERVVLAKYDNWGYDVYSWIRGLIKWLFNLNLCVGLFNLLPLVIVDGGRMFNLALDRTIRSKDTRKKIISFIAAFLLLAILLGLVVQYIGNPFLLFK